MQWLGGKLKEMVSAKGLTQNSFGAALGVSRQTVVDWCKGQVPKGNHLLAICRLLDSEPTSFFAEESANVRVPLHRQRGVAKVTVPMTAAATSLATEYADFFDPADLPVTRLEVPSNDLARVPLLAAEFRRLAGLADADEPLDYQHAFRLLEALGICVVCRRFPPAIKAYAFYTEINRQRVVFVNAETKVMDLIFPLLHEATHAVRGTGTAEGYDRAEEDFCDAVANSVQFPPGYVDRVHQAIAGCPPGIMVNTLKEYASRKHHAIYGIVKCIEAKHGSLNLQVSAADANLRKSLPRLEDVLFRDGAATFAGQLRALSPLFYWLLLKRLPGLSARRLAELLDIESVLDAVQVREELEREARKRVCPV